MSDRYGPHSAEVRAILARAEQLTLDEADQLGDAWYRADDDGAWNDAVVAARVIPAGRAANADGLAVVARRYPAMFGAMSAVGDVAAAYAALDELEPAQFEAMARPWHQAFGRPAVTR